MCAIIGYSCQQLSVPDIETIQKLFEESQIRGKHASGISYIDNGRVITKIAPIPGGEFIKTIDLNQFIGTEFNMVGHCRYSTSDIKYNQPIADEGLSVVHNGVITQEPFDKWTELFGYENFKTKNDTEILFKSIKDENSLSDFHDASIATCVLESNPVTLSWYRNGKRPTSFYKKDKTIIISSTKDILLRSNLPLENIKATIGGTLYVAQHGYIEKYPNKLDKDLQNV